MTEIQNPKQKNNALNGFRICILKFEIYLEFGAWNL
jgi:hypothetical protein